MLIYVKWTLETNSAPMHNTFEQLQQQVTKFKQEHERWPKVRISPDFWERNADGIARLSRQGIPITVDENIRLENTFLLETVDKAGHRIDTIADLKAYADKLVEEGKGDWPVRIMPSDTNTYHKLNFYAIIPGEAPGEGAELFPSFAGTPEGEFILVQIEG